MVFVTKVTPCDKGDVSQTFVKKVAFCDKGVSQPQGQPWTQASELGLVTRARVNPCEKGQGQTRGRVKASAEKKVNSKSWMGV